MREKAGGQKQVAAWRAEPLRRIEGRAQAAALHVENVPRLMAEGAYKVGGPEKRVWVRRAPQTPRAPAARPL